MPSSEGSRPGQLIRRGENGHQEHTWAAAQHGALKRGKCFSFVALVVEPQIGLFLLWLMVISLSGSAGPQKCASCIQEGIYEEGISILEISSVSANALLENKEAPRCGSYPSQLLFETQVLSVPCSSEAFSAAVGVVVGGVDSPALESSPASRSGALLQR